MADSEYRRGRRQTLPTKTFYDKGTITVDGERIEQMATCSKAHTDGDYYAFFPKSNVLGDQRA